MKALSTPKKIIEVEEDRSRNRLRSEGPKMRRIRKLSKPRIRKEIIPNEWMFTKGLKNFKPTERLLKISQPKKYDELSAREDPHRIPQNALNYKGKSSVITSIIS